jgi:hypothetical protein
VVKQLPSGVALLASGVFACVAAAISITAAQNGTVVVPPLLQTIERSANCQVPTQRVTGLEATSWILELPDQAGYVAWCKAGDHVFDILVALASTRHQWSACPSRVTVHEDHTLPDFTVLQPRTSPQNPDGLRSFSPFDRNGILGRPIRDAGDDGGYWAIEWAVDNSANRVICHRGRWLIAGSH